MCSDALVRDVRQLELDVNVESRDGEEKKVVRGIRSRKRGREGGKKPRNIIYTFSKRKNELMVVQRRVQLVCDV